MTFFFFAFLIGNGSRGQLGTGDCADRAALTSVKLPKGCAAVQKCAAGAFHSLLLLRVSHTYTRTRTRTRTHTHTHTHTQTGWFGACIWRRRHHAVGSWERDNLPVAFRQRASHLLGFSHGAHQNFGPTCPCAGAGPHISFFVFFEPTIINLPLSRLTCTH